MIAVSLEMCGLTHEVNDDDMKNDVREDEVSEAPFWRNSKELLLVLWIRLQTQAN